MPVSISGTNGVTFPDSSLQTAAASPYVLKNRIINGDMVIDQRNAGASLSLTGSLYTVDRWIYAADVGSKFTFQQNYGAVTPPVGFSKYAGFYVSSAYTPSGSEISVFQQAVEGFNFADLAWGTANAKTITLSFQVYSSLTGTFSGAFRNNGTTRSYPFSYSIPVANTWTSISVTIPGDTSGTWVGATNGVGVYLNFDIGSANGSFRGPANAWATTTGNGYIGVTNSVQVVATAGATWYVTGVQLEIGTTATPFERRLYDKELVSCQRYYYKIGGTDTNEVMANGVFQSATNAEFLVNMPITMRAAPSASYSGTLSNFKVSSSATFTPTTLTFDIFGINTLRASTTVSGATAGYACYLRSSTSTAQTINVSAEL
jgi:hypothetical protein